MNIFIGYTLRCFVDAVTPLIESAKSEELMILMDKTNNVLKKEVDEGAIEEMQNVKDLSNKELLSMWHSYYDMICIKYCYESKDVVKIRILENECIGRGLEKEILVGSPRWLVCPAPEEVLKTIVKMSDEELLEEWGFLQPALFAGELVNTVNNQERYLLRSELDKRGLNIQ